MRSPKRGRRDRKPSTRRGAAESRPAEAERAAAGETPTADAAAPALTLLTRALTELKEKGRDEVRDSDVKRKILSIDRSFDESALGFPKFSRFLQFAGEQGVVKLHRLDTGNYRVSLADGESVPSDDGVEEADAGSVSAATTAAPASHARHGLPRTCLRNAVALSASTKLMKQ